MSIEQEVDYKKYISNFNYEERNNMKIQIPELLELLAENKVQFIDVRFKEEYEIWNISFAKNIPLNELPERLVEIDKSKLVVTTCPHNDRAIMARILLLENGINAKYLSNGLLGLIDYLRGDKAKELYNLLQNI